MDPMRPTTGQQAERMQEPIPAVSHASPLRRFIEPLRREAS